MDYQGNSKKDKAEANKPGKVVEKVTTGEVLIQKKSLGQKFKDVFIADNLKNVWNYVLYDVCVPAFQNLLVESVSKGVDRMVNGTRGGRPGSYGMMGPRTTYNRPPSRSMGYPSSALGLDNLDRRGLPPAGLRQSRQSLNTGIVVATKEEARAVLDRMTDIVDQFQVATVGDLYDLVGVTSTHVDQKWGWEDIRDARIQEVREGYLLDLPQPQPLQ